MAGQFRRPEDMKGDEPTIPVGSRVKRSTKELLEQAAAKVGEDGESLSWLIGQILEDWAKWYSEQKPKR